MFNSFSSLARFSMPVFFFFSLSLHCGLQNSWTKVNLDFEFTKVMVKKNYFKPKALCNK